MQIKKAQSTPTNVTLTVTADEKELDGIKKKVVAELGSGTKVSGFRVGKAPAHLVEKQLDQNVLQTEFLDAAVNQLFLHAIEHENLKPVTQPNISITKFVPFSTVEFSAELSVIGDITLVDYKTIKLSIPKTNVTTESVCRAKDRDSCSKNG